MGKRNRDGAAGGEGAKKKQHWQNSYVGKAVPRGTRGCMVSCVTGKENQASKEAQSLMIQYVEGLQPAKAADQAEAGSDIRALIADEVADIGKTEKRPVELHKTGIAGLLYLSFTKAAGDASPVDFVTALARDVKATKQCKSRLCLRFFPVEHSCNAALDDIKAMAAKLVPAAFPDRNAEAEPETFNVQYEHRASPKIDRKALIDAFVDYVPKVGYKVSLDKADRTILVQLIKSCCTVSFVRDFKELSKFNIRELSGWVDPTKDEGVSDSKANDTRSKTGARGTSLVANVDVVKAKDAEPPASGGVPANREGVPADSKSAAAPSVTKSSGAKAEADSAIGELNEKVEKATEADAAPTSEAAATTSADATTKKEPTSAAT